MPVSSVKTNLLLVYDHLETGGGTRVNINIARSLASKHQVYLLSGQYPHSETENLLREYQQYCQKTYIYPLNPTFPSWLSKLTIIYRSFIMGKSIIKKHDLHIILTNITLSAFGISLIPHSKNLKVINLFHGFLVFERTSLSPEEVIQTWSLIKRLLFKFNNQLLFQIQKIVLLKADLVLVFSQYSKRLLSQHIPNLHLVQIITPPIYSHSTKVSKKQLNLPQARPLLICASRLEPRKGIDLLLQAMTKISAHTQAVLIILGPVYEPNYFLSLMKIYYQLQLQHRVYFFGPIPHAQMAAYFSAADLVIMPSRQLETFGLTTAEALLNKTPAIGFNLGATPEILKQVDPQLVVSNINSPALAATIIRYLKSSSSYQHQTRLKAYKVGSSYSSTKFLDQFESLFN